MQDQVKGYREAVYPLEQERQALEGELGDLKRTNKSLKLRLARERDELRKMSESTRKRTAEVLEARANRILEELHELG